MAAEPLVCPRCATTNGLDERFCPACGMPLVHPGDTGTARPITARHERARKVKAQYTEGQLVCAAGARNQAEAELIQGMLLEEGVPSLLRRTAGFDVPDYLAGGPRDVVVPASGLAAAREVLLQAELVDEHPTGAGPVSPWRLMAGLLAGLALVAVVAWLGTEVLV